MAAGGWARGRRLIGAVGSALVLGLAVWLLVGRDGDGGARSDAPRATVAAESAGPDEAGLRFSREELRVPVGGVVVFRNNDDVAHTFTADGGLFDSGPVAPGKAFSFSFPAAGELTYHCEIHPSMKARVVVEAEG